MLIVTTEWDLHDTPIDSIHAIIHCMQTLCNLPTYLLLACRCFTRVLKVLSEQGPSMMMLMMMLVCSQCQQQLVAESEEVAGVPSCPSSTLLPSMQQLFQQAVACCEDRQENPRGAHGRS